MSTKNNTPTSIFEYQDKCPSCGSFCNIEQDLDDNDFCNDCRPMEINIIVAASENLTIGKDNDLPWKIPSDLKKFKQITTGSIVIMGRKCYESIGRPLPGRQNIVITRNTDLTIEGCEVVNSINQALSLCKNDSREIFIIGGAEIYKQTFSFATKLYLTEIKGNVDGDVKLEGMNLEEWSLVYESELFEENGTQFRFLEYI